MPRIAYKPKFLEAQQQLETTQSHLAAVQAELTRVKNVLAVEGDFIVTHEVDPCGKGVLQFAPVQYECVTALIESTWYEGELKYRVPFNRVYSWRGRRLEAR